MIWRLTFILFLWAVPAHAQDFSGLAKVDPSASSVTNRWGKVTIQLRLSQAVPYRILTAVNPDRLILEFREVDFTGLTASDFLDTDLVTAITFGSTRPGWSRLSATLARPMAVQEAELKVADDAAYADLRVLLKKTDAEAFHANATDLDEEQVSQPTQTVPSGPIVIAIDPGHGGVDPGAQHGGVDEADVMQSLGIELAEAIDRTGNLRAVLTRNSDTFVALDQRMTIARSAGAKALISLHADALEKGQASGASVYTLSRDAQDDATTRMAERHERGDLLAGLDLTDQDDRVAGALMDLARLETGPQGDRLADQLILAMALSGVQMHSNARRSGPFAVLNAPDFASVLIEVGYLSDPDDRAALLDPAMRQVWIAGIVAGLQSWAQAEAIKAPLLRQ